MSNFYPIDLDTPYGKFKSIESFWSYLVTGVDTHDITNPLDARRVLTENERSYQCTEEEFELLITNAIEFKMDFYRETLLTDPYFINLELPIIHAWVYNGKYVSTGKKSTKILVDALNGWRNNALIWGF